MHQALQEQIMELTVLQYGILTAGAFFAGLIDSVAGGGGLISVPLLLAVGLPPHAALATNKLQASFGSFTAMMRYRSSGLVSIRSLIPGILCTAAGAVSGALLIQRIRADILETAVPVLLAALLVYTLISPNLGLRDSAPRMGRSLFLVLFGLLLGFYDGFFGPGTGSFWTIAFVGLGGINIRRATAATKVMNFTSNAAALTIFLFSGRIVLAVGLAMAVGQLAGAWSGSHLVLTRGTRFVRIFFIIVVAATVVDLLVEQIRG